MPPGMDIRHVLMSEPNDSGSSRKKSSKLLDLPMPAVTEDDDSSGAKARKKRKPKVCLQMRKKYAVCLHFMKNSQVIGKAPPTKMSEDGSEWGERCIDIYEIVDKVGEGTYIF